MKKVITTFLITGMLLLSVGLVSADGTFDELQDKINSETNTTNLADNYKYNSTTDGAYVDGVVISKDNYVLNGNFYTIDGSNEARIFKVTGNNVTLKNIKLINGFSSEEGGAIYSPNTINIISSTFENNNGGFGGAIHSENTINIIDSTFKNNKAMNNGGAFHTYDTVNINNSRFEGNFANGEGGVIYGTTINICGSIFILNNANRNGGVIRASTVNIYDSFLSYNSADSSGGAIRASTVNVYTSTFSSNSVKNGPAGAISGMNINVFDSEFSTNSANGDGGGINGNNINVVCSTFIGNMARSSNGGAISASNLLTTNGSVFIGNQANNGGALFAINSVNSFNSNFSNNFAKIGSAINANNVNVLYSNFTDEYPENYGVIYLNGLGNISNNYFNPDTDFNFLIYNNGILYLSNNTMTSSFNKKIFNNGTITSTLTLTILNNSTVYTNYNRVVNLNATVTDDNNNLITGGKIKVQNSLLNLNGLLNNQNNTNSLHTNNFHILKVGTFTLTGSYTGGSNLNILTGTLSVDQDNPTIELSFYNFTHEMNGTVIINFNNAYEIGLHGVSISINGKIYSVDIVNQTGQVIIDALPFGIYNATVEYAANENYTATNYIKSFNVGQGTPIINLIVNDTFTNVNATVLVNLLGSKNIGLNGIVNVFVNGKEYNVTVSNGAGNTIIDQLPAGAYTVNGIFSGDTNYAPTTNSVSFNVNQYIIEGNISETEDNNKTNPFLEEDNNQTEDNGTSPNSTNNQNSNDSDSPKSPETTLNHNLLEANDITMFYKNGTKYSVTLTDEEGNPIENQNVSITVNGNTYYRTTNEEGVAILSINLAPGEYEIIAVFNGTNGEVTITTSLDILSVIEADDFTKYFRNGTQYEVTILDNEGNPLAGVNVSLNINGVFYNRTTNDKGVAILTINLNPNEYIITASYNGQSFSSKIIVLATLTAEDVNKNINGAATYNVKVIGDNGQVLVNQKVEININGVIYFRFSDENGIAKLNINLDAGSYIATVTWNSYSTSNNVTVES